MKPKRFSKKTVEAAPEPSLNLSRGQLWLFRLAAPLVVLLVLAGGAELALRWGGYGYPTDFFLKTEIKGKDFYISNARFGYRFFPPALARTPTPMRMAVEKPAHTYRIFVFGESAAMGDPDPTFGAWRYLQVMLQERFPGTDFEVVCVAMTAINSHVILPMARECAKRDGDLWIIYMGNNEMVGPFGGGTVFGSRVAGIEAIRASLAVKRFRFGQWLNSLAQRWNPAASPKTWSGLNMFKEHQLRYDDPNRLRAYGNFKENLDDILQAGRKAGVPVILSTVGSSLKDCAPFGSLHPASFSASQQNEWDAIYTNGCALEAAGDLQGALKKYEQAAAVDGHYAELHYRAGRCELALTNDTLALREFEQARDDDTLAFRADAPINQIIADAARTHANDGVDFLDAYKRLADSSPAGISGNELFYEHVHLNFDGNYVLARALADETLKLLPKPMLAQGKNDWASAELCDRRLAVTLWDRFRVWQENYSRVSEPPFTEQLNDVPRAKFYIAKLRALNGKLTEQTRAQSRVIYEEALKLRPDDYYLRENYAQFLDESGDLADAPAEEEKVGELLPQNPMTPCIVGRLQVRLGNIEEAEKTFARALAIREDYVPALNEMGELLANQRKTTEAERYFARALKVDPASVEASQDWGFAEQNAGKWKEASALYHAAAEGQPNGPADYFDKAANLLAEHHRAESLDYFNVAIRMNPNFWQARYLFGAVLLSGGDIAGAQAQFTQVARLRPDFVPGRLNYGLTLAKTGQFAEALKELQATLRFDPTNVVARQNVQALQAQQTNTP